MRRVSLNARLAQDAEATDEIYVVLLEVQHPDLERPLRLSTDNTERLSIVPLYYGTRSTWRGADPVDDPYLWVVASTLLPSDVEDRGGDRATAWRVHLTKAGLGLRLMIWRDGDVIEFANVGVKHALEIEEGDPSLRSHIEVENFID